MKTPQNTYQSYPQRSLHSGYRYQDLIGATLFAQALIENFELVQIEHKRYVGDKFDDISFLSKSVWTHLQIKHSAYSKSFGEKIFLSKDSDLAINELIRGSIQASGRQGHLRLLTTMRPPKAKDRNAFLLPATSPTIFEGTRSTCWKLKAAAIWPSGEVPRWPSLKGFSRKQFMAFTEQFTIELDAPQMSGSLNESGELEKLLLRKLSIDLGVERHPNNRDAADVAARFINLAAAAKASDNRKFKPVDLIFAAGLRTDRGRVEQTHPLNNKQYVKASLRYQIGEHLGRTQRIIVTGEPGAGKSWALERLCNDLRSQGWIVARHYCYLEPGDPDLHKRVAITTMTANLVSELLEDARFDHAQFGLAGDMRTLERILEFANQNLSLQSNDKPSQKKRPRKTEQIKGVVLIVDGVDHASRVDSRGERRDAPIDFCEQLASLALPSKSTLIVSSQPGTHLNPLRKIGAVDIEAPRFTPSEVQKQLSLLGVFKCLKQSGLSEERSPVLEMIIFKAAGNPLFSRALATFVINAVNDKTPALPSSLVSAIPATPGNLTQYYSYLLQGAEAAPDAGHIAEYLSFLDFLVTEEELSSILPEYGPDRISKAVKHLRPLLVSSSAGSGMRIYHESVRRFVCERIERAPERSAALLRPIIHWLESRGFFSDERSYRHLLPCLRKAGRNPEILQKAGRDFISRSIVELHPMKAIRENLRIFAQVAAEAQDFPILTRLVELSRSLMVAFWEKLSDPEQYARAFIEMRGVQPYAGRLLFEGRPTHSKDIGIRLCALIDEYGGSAPWQEYFRIKSEQSNTAPREDPQLFLDALRGRLRLSPEETLPKLKKWLLLNKNKSSSSPIRQTFRVVWSVLGADRLDDLADNMLKSPSSDGFLFYIEKALALYTRGEREAARTVARKALTSKTPTSVLCELLKVGFSPKKLVVSCPPPTDLVDSILANTGGPDPERVANFIGAVRIYAADGRDLSKARRKLEGVGWYRRWLRFIIDLADALQKKKGVLSTLQELAIEESPFVGSPRACDLYRIHDQTVGSIELALSHLDKEEIPEAVEVCLAISSSTTTYLFRSPNGPLEPLSLLRLLVPHAKLLNLEKLERRLLEMCGNQYYDTLAAANLLMARLWNAQGNMMRADTAWRRAGIYLSAYGLHKDVTIFDLIESLKTLSLKVSTGTTERIQKLQPLPVIAYTHSDAKETTHAPGAWFETYAAISPGAAASTLADTLLDDERVPCRINNKALRDVLASAPASIPPLLVHLLWKTLPPSRDVTDRLTAVERLIKLDRKRGEEAFTELSALIDGDLLNARKEAARELTQFATRHGISTPPLGRIAIKEPDEAPPLERKPSQKNGPFLTAKTAPTLLLQLRQVWLDHFSQPIDHDVFASELIPHLTELYQDRGKGCVLEVIQDFCRHQLFSDRAVVIERVAENFQRVDNSLAADLYATAWCFSGGSWSRFGGPKHSELLRKAFACDKKAALSRFAFEVADSVVQDHSLGVSKRIIEVLVDTENLSGATECWEESFTLISSRLPITGDVEQPFEPAGPQLNSEGSVRAYAKLLAVMAACPEYDRRRSAVAGLCELFRHFPGIIAEALTSLFSSNARFTERVTSLCLFENMPLDLQTIAGKVSETLLNETKSHSFTLSESAAAVLRRFGQDPETNPQQSKEPLPSAELTIVREILELDRSSRIERLTALWSNFPNCVAMHYRKIWNKDPQNSKTLQSQREYQFSRVTPWLPPLPMHDQKLETLEIALDASILELRVHLYKTGQWTAKLSDEIREILAPDIWATVAKGRSRIIRPNLSLPSASTPEVGKFIWKERGSSWLRIAYWEHEIKEPDSYGDDGHQFTLDSGLWSGGSSPPKSIPFEVTGPNFKWHLQKHPLLDSQLQTKNGWLAALWLNRDIFDWGRGLTLCEELRDMFRLEAAEIPQPFNLVDQNKTLAATYRYWRMWPYSYDHSPPVPLITGGELLLRSDLAQKLFSQSHSSIYRVVSIDSEKLPAKPLR